MPISHDLLPILWAKAKREDKKVPEVIDELLRQSLWDEPGALFKGREYRVQPDLFSEHLPNHNLDSKPP